MIFSACGKPLIAPDVLDESFYLKKIRSTPDDLNIHRELMERYKDSGLMNIPIDVYKKAEEKNPDNYVVQYVLGYAYLLEGSPESLKLAERYLKASLALKPRFPDALTAFGDYYLKTGNESLALEKWNEARQSDDKFVPVYLSMARYYRLKHQYDRAEEEYEDALSYRPNQMGRVYLEFGTMYMEMNDLIKAEEMLLKARGLEPRLAMIHYKLGQVYAMQGDNDKAIRLYRSGRNFDPDNSQVAYDLAYIFLEKNNIKYAILSFERGLTIDGLAEEKSKELVSRINKSVSQGIDYLAQIADSSQSGNFNLLYFIGKLYLTQKNEQLALKYMKQASLMPNTNADVHYQLGILYDKLQPKVAKTQKEDKPKVETKQVIEPLKKEQNEVIKTPEPEPTKTEPEVSNAQEQYRKAVDLGSSEADLLFKVAQGYLDEGDEDKYIEVAQRALAINSNRVDVHLKLADIFFKRAETYKKNGNVDEEEKAILNSINHYEQVVMLEPDAQRWYNLGLLYERSGKSKAVKAVRAYEQAIQLKPDFAMAYYRRGTFMLNYKVGQVKVLMYKPEVAIQDLKKAIEIDPKLADAYVDLGLAYHQINMPEMATEEFEKAVQTDPNNLRAHVFLAQDYAQTGDNQKVLTHLSAAAELSHDNAEILKSLGGMLLKYGTDDDIPKARETLRKANDLKPDDPEILMNFGYTLYLAKMFNDAIIRLKRAIELQPVYPEAHYNIALAYSGIGEYELAREHWEKVIEQSPNTPIAEKSVEFISRMKKPSNSKR